uniref:uncharacterized protein LOC120328572 n=1 Tax=Styela clava TaxID=7725 RepID=UPI0019399E5D|nr:uncharacterized protein LOC120328572 [Styela clava]
MGCGSSKSVTTKSGTGDIPKTFEHKTDSENSQTVPKVTENAKISNKIADNTEVYRDTEELNQCNAVNRNKEENREQILDSKHKDAEESLTPAYSFASDDLENLEDALADETVLNVLQNIQSLNTKPANVQIKSKTSSQKHVEFDLSPQLESLSDNEPTNVSTPIPSAQPVDGKLPANNLKNSEIFFNALHKACSVADNSRLPILAVQSDLLRLDRTFYCFKGADLLIDITSKMTNLCILDLHGGQCGPVAFRAIVNALINDHHIRNLNLSDNLANPECSEMLGQLLSKNTTLQHLNVSGNLLGKDAFSRYVGTALQENSSLKSLDLSSCGATDLHCLCESLRNSTCSAMSTLIASHNQITDGHQFAIDLSLILENANCKLKFLDVTNTNISSSGMNAIVACLKNNQTLEKMLIGQNSIADVVRLGEFIVNAATHDCLQEISLNKTKIEGDSSENIEILMNDEETSTLTHIGIADCGLTDTFIQKLASCLDGKLSKLEYLDISNNNDLSIDCIKLFDKMCKGSLKSLKIALLEKLDGISSIISQFSSLVTIDFTRSRISPTELNNISSTCQQTFQSITLNGVKLSGTPALKSVMTANCFSSLSFISLSGCQLNDADSQPIYDAIKSSKVPIKQIDLSVNRLSSIFLSGLTEALLVHDSHSLTDLNLANNDIGDSGLICLTKIWQTSSHTSTLENINLSCNSISASSIVNFFSIFKAQRFNLNILDLRNQNEPFGEEDITVLASTLEEVFFKQGTASQNVHFTIALCGLGGTDVPQFCLLDSSAIQTDFGNLRKTAITLNDVLQIGKGLRILNEGDSRNSPYNLSIKAWNNIIGSDVPKWASVTTELEKSVYISHTPGTVTQQRLQGTLEMDADCEVKDIFLVKDPIMRKPTGAAWVLFENKMSMNNAINWYTSGYAQMYGTPFLISEIPVCISDETTNAESLAKQDIAARELEEKKKQEQDRRMMEENEQLAAERAQYRAAHPAYQGGRIS